MSFWADDLDTTPYPDDLGNWIHWAGTFNNSASGGQRQRTLYRNSILIASGIAESDYVGSGQIDLGGGILFTSFADIDDLRFYVGRVLNPQDIYHIYQGSFNDNARLVLHYTFDDPLGTRIISDSSPARDFASLVGSAALHALCPPQLDEGDNGTCVPKPGACPAGHTGGLFNCSACAAGTYKPAPGGAACTLCPPDTQSIAGATACVAWAAPVPSGLGTGPCELPRLQWAVSDINRTPLLPPSRFFCFQVVLTAPAG